MGERLNIPVTFSPVFFFSILFTLTSSFLLASHIFPFYLNEHCSLFPLLLLAFLGESFLLLSMLSFLSSFLSPQPLNIFSFTSSYSLFYLYSILILFLYIFLYHFFFFSILYLYISFNFSSTIYSLSIFILFFFMSTSIFSMFVCFPKQCIFWNIERTFS